MRRERNTEPRAVATGSRLVETKLALNTTASATISFESIVARPGRYYHPSAAAALGTPVCSRFRICVPLELVVHWWLFPCENQYRAGPFPALTWKLGPIYCAAISSPCSFYNLAPREGSQ